MARTHKIVLNKFNTAKKAIRERNNSQENLAIALFPLV